jgi:hypothetical protein
MISVRLPMAGVRCHAKLTVRAVLGDGKTANWMEKVSDQPQ